MHIKSRIKALALATTVVALMIAAPALFSSADAGDLNKQIPVAAQDPASTATSETAVLAGGCFWGQQGVFEHVKGVTRVVAGYAGGAKDTATYDQVTTETTGHAEAVQITFDPRQVSYATLLRIYFSVAHDPTQLNRQGPDSGTSYRSAVFPANSSQAATAKAYIAQLDAAHVFAAPIVTKIEPLKGFYAAEAYHQDYLIHHPESAYIQINDLPKIEGLKKVWPQFYQSQPARLARN